jgi:membrane-bound ClpP family serine protease
LSCFRPYSLWIFYLFAFLGRPFLYIPIFLFGAFININMMISMKLPVKKGLEEMIGKEALVIKEINPEGKIKINGEFWAVAVRGPVITKGRMVKIV